MEGKKPDIEVIQEIDLYKCEPWDLSEGNKKGKEKELVILKSLNGKLCKPKYEAKCYEKPPQIVNVKTSPRRIQQPR